MMLQLDKTIKLDAKTIAATNVAEEFEDADRRRIGEWVYDGYMQDKRSRSKWEKRTEAAMDLAMQIQKAKNFPWPNCSNIAFPLVTIAVLQFHSRAYPALIQAPDIVKCRVLGPDPDGKEQARAARVSRHMSWQVLEQDADWEEQADRALIHVPVVGCAFKKTYRSAEMGYNESDLVYARDLVLDYWAKSVDTCPRKTHVIPLQRNEIWEKVKREIFCDVLESDWFKAPAPQPTQTAQTAASDNRAGVSPPAQTDETTPFITLEQHCNLDLDGDGYAEPWIITIEEKNHTVLRIVSACDSERDIERNSKHEIIRCTPRQYFTKIPFIPSPDGGIYDMGFGVLLGPLNESVNSIVNQLVDAGTMQNTAGGFLGRGAKIRGGVYTFAPFQWQHVDSTGDDLRKSMVPLEVREPSAVLFSLLALLIEYTNRIPGTTEVSVGENPGQNTPAETSRNMLNQGLKIYNALFKRLWRALGEEFKKLYSLNTTYLRTRQDFGDGQFAEPADYAGSPAAIVPEADPNVASDAEKQQQTLFVAQRMLGVPGYDIEYCERMLLKAWRVPDADKVYPGKDKVPPLPNPKVQVEQIKLQGKQAQFEAQKAIKAAELMEEHRLNTAKILQLGAQAAKLIEEAGGVRAGHEIAALEAVIGAMKLHNESILGHAKLLLEGQSDDSDSGTKRKGVARLAATPGDQGLALLGDGGASQSAGAMV